MYGDGLFETLPVAKGVPIFWGEHWQRLIAGAKFMGIEMPCSEAELLDRLDQLMRGNNTFDGVLRIQLSRGASPRGYSVRGVREPKVIITISDMPALPQSWRVMLSSVRIPASDPLTQIKTCNKLHQVLARKEAEQLGGDEALILNNLGHVAECASANIFWINNETVYTPSLEAGTLPGVTRRKVLELCQARDITVVEENATLEQVMNAHAAFATLSTFGVVPIREVDKTQFGPSGLLMRLQDDYHQLLQREILRGKG